MASSAFAGYFDPMYGAGDTQPNVKKRPSPTAPSDIPRPAAVAPAANGNPFDFVPPEGVSSTPQQDAQSQVQNQNIATKNARTGGGAFDPALPMPQVFNPTGPSVLNPNAPNFTSPTFKPAAAAPTTAATPTPDVAAPADTGATSISGRKLGYGQNINGVPTFSDGSGGPNAVARTMSDQQIKDLGTRINTIPDANFARPAPGVAASIATGGAVTPEVGQFDFSRPTPAVTNPNDAVADAERGARTDVASILNEDPRSALGIAARNARISLTGVAGARTSRYGGGVTPLQSTIGALIDRANAPVANVQASTLATQREQGENTRENTRANASVLAAKLGRPEARPIQMEDGTTGEKGADGRVHALLDASGNPVRELQGKPPIDQASYGKLLQDNINKVAGIDPITGMVKDAVTGKPRAITPAELRAATMKGSELTRLAFSNPAAGNNIERPQGKPTLQQFMSSAKSAPQNAGKSEQELTAYYNKTYGA